MKVLLLLLIFIQFLFSVEKQGVVPKFVGNKEFSDLILQSIAGFEKPPFYKFWQKKEPFLIDDSSKLRDELIDFYHSKGFFRVSVELSEQNGSAIYTINEGERIKVDSVTVESLIYLDDIIYLRKGDFFDANLFVKSKDEIKARFGRIGTPGAKLDAKAYIDLESYKATLSFKTTDTIPLFIGDINISSPSSIEPDYIKNYLEFEYGELYDSQKIDKSYKNLYALGVFDSVSIRPRFDTKSENLPIDINLTTTKTRSYRIGAGYDTDEGARIRAGWINRNYFGNLKRFEAMVEASKVRQNIGAKITVPMRNRFAFEDLAKYEFVNYDGFSERIFSNQFKIKKEYKTTLHRVGFLSEIGSVEADSESRYITDSNFRINALTYEYELERRDFAINAKKGYWIGWNVEFADSVIGSNLSYTKSNLELKAVHEFLKEGSLDGILLGGRVNIGTINSFKGDDVPVFKRYFAGGSFSNRGYQYRRVGQKDEYGNNIGGKTIVDYSIEGRYQLGSSLSAALFWDSTLLSSSSNSFAGSYKNSVGIGVRYETGVGPIRFDIGYPLNEERRSVVFHISFGQPF